MTQATPTITLPNGVVIPFLSQGDASGTPLVLLHAIADSMRAFEPLLPHLPPWIRALAPSQRGHGDATGPSTGYRPGDFAADLVAFLDGVGVASAVIAGGSSGGVVARRFAIDHPERTLGLVLLGAPYALSEKPGIQEMWDSTFSKMTDPVDPQLVRDFAAATTSPWVPRDFIEMVIEENLKAPAHVWTQTMAGLLEDDSHRLLGRITAPTLLIWGLEDPILSLGDQKAVAAAVPNARLVVLEGLGHAFYWEDPGRVAAELVAFVESLSRRA